MDRMKSYVVHFRQVIDRGDNQAIMIRCPNRAFTFYVGRNIMGLQVFADENVVKNVLSPRKFVDDICQC